MKFIVLILLLLIAGLQYRLWFGDGNVREFRRQYDQIDDLRKEANRRKERNAALEAEVMDLKQGFDAIEERARQDLGMIREGEVFVQIIDPHQTPTPQPTRPPSAKPTAGESRPRTHLPTPTKIPPRPTETPE